VRGHFNDPHPCNPRAFVCDASLGGSSRGKLLGAAVSWRGGLGAIGVLSHSHRVVARR
jgi:hypothetical protein